MIDYINNFLSFPFIGDVLIPILGKILLYGAISALVLIVGILLYIINNEKNSIINMIAVGIMVISFIVGLLSLYLFVLGLIFTPLIICTILLKNMLLTVCTLPEIVVGFISAFICTGTLACILTAIDNKK